MRIFLSHRSQNKPLVREFKDQLPRFLDSWLDEERLSWGDTFPVQLQSSIQSAVDFVIIFLDKVSLDSKWVKQELEWALAREKKLGRIFVLPILLEDIPSSDLPKELSERLQLRLSDFSKASVESLGNQATLALFKLVVDCLSTVQLDIPRTQSLFEMRNQLSAGQARLLGCIERKRDESGEITQRLIEGEMNQSHASGELFYRLESLIAQGFLEKRRIPEEGQFSYRLSDDFADAIQNV